MSFAPQTKLNTPSPVYTYADVGQHVFGLEYMGATYAKLRTAPGTALAITFDADSTGLGSGASTADYQPATLLPILLAARGIKATITNRSVSGKNTADWLATYLPAALAAAVPDVYVMGYLMNDALAGITPAQSIANLETGLASLRATWPATGTSVIVKMPNTASDDANGRTEAVREALTEGVRRLCRKYGCAFVDVYGAFPEARANLASVWLDAAKVHPNEDHYMVQWDMIAQVIVPDGLKAMNGRPTNVSPGSGFTQGSEPMQAVSDGRLVTAQGFLQGPSTTVASGATVGTIPVGFRPLTTVYFADAQVWNGTGGGTASNWETVRCILNTNGTIVTMAATTLSVARLTLEGVTWRRA